MSKVIAVAIALLLSPAVGASQLGTAQADQLLRQLREWPPFGFGTVRSDGTDPDGPRTAIYQQLRSLGPEAIPAFVRDMNDPDVQTRRAVALFLLGTPVNSWSDSEDFDNYRAALTRVITDPDTRVRELAAQAAGNLGPRGARVVPALISLLKYEDVGSRNTACIGLAGIGPAARDALPALRQALSDQHPEVRFFAQRAVDKIDVK